uniref:SKA complex subunit 1 n=1 Tax=Leptobrachium leishanense TaxID=445787 RepID=A0A8C5P8R4_9ANUR
MISLTITPEVTLADEPVKIQVCGLPPQRLITLRAWLKDERGEIFYSQAFYKSDNEGKIDLDCTPATGGDFQGVCPMGLLWALKPITPFQRLVKREVMETPFYVHVELYINVISQPTPHEDPLASKVVERWYVAPGIKRIKIKQGKVRGALFLPPGDGPFPGVIDIFGATGGLLEFRSSLLACRGFACLALAYFDYDDLPSFLGIVELEYYEEAIEVLLGNPKCAEAMDSADLDDLCFHVNSKISLIKKTLQLRNIGNDPSLSCILNKVAHEMQGLSELLNKVETEVQKQETIAKSLKELESNFAIDLSEATHLKENIPLHLPKKTPSSEFAKCEEAEVASKVVVPAEPVKKPLKEKSIKEMELITVQEFASVPPYMKNRLPYDQINSLVEEMNRAVVGKYKILFQPMKSLSTTAKKQLVRFKEEETKDTKGHFFVVEQDIKEFTQVKVDKRFHSILGILRHCHRIREMRTKGLIRYMIC